jgi:hypothetical protein
LGFERRAGSVSACAVADVCAAAREQPPNLAEGRQLDAQTEPTHTAHTFDTVPFASVHMHMQAPHSHTQSMFISSTARVESSACEWRNVTSRVPKAQRPNNANDGEAFAEKSSIHATSRWHHADRVCVGELGQGWHRGYTPMESTVRAMTDFPAMKTTTSPTYEVPHRPRQLRLCEGCMLVCWREHHPPRSTLSVLNRLRRPCAPAQKSSHDTETGINMTELSKGSARQLP